MSKAEEVVNRANSKEHAKRLARAITPHHTKLLEIAWEEKRKKFPIIGDFSLKNPHVRAALVRLGGSRIVSMAETSKNDLTRLLTNIYDREKIPGTDEIRREIQQSGVETSKYRAERLARTETAIAMNAGATASYREAGIEKVEVLDSDDDEDCASVNGTIQTLEWAEENPIAHPNCVRAFAPIVE